MIRSVLQAVVTASLMTICFPAHAETTVPLTKEACEIWLTTDPAGPRLDPTNLRVYSTVQVDGWTYTVYPTRLIKDICDEAVLRSAERAVSQQQIATAELAKETAEEDGRSDAVFRREMEQNIFHKHPLEMSIIMIFLAVLGTLVAVLLSKVFIACVMWVVHKFTGGRGKEHFQGIPGDPIT